MLLIMILCIKVCSVVLMLIFDYDLQNHVFVGLLKQAVPGSAPSGFFYFTKPLELLHNIAATYP